MTNKSTVIAAKRLNNIKINCDSDLMHLNFTWCRYAMSDNVNFRRSSHQHTFFELHYVTNEYMTLSTGNKTYTVKKGQFMLIPPCTEHEIVFQSNNFKKLVMGFDITIKPNHSDSIFYKHVLNIIETTQARIYNETDFMPVLQNKLLAECNKNQYNLYSKLCSTQQLLICEILTAIASEHSPSTVQDRFTAIKETFWTEKVTVYISDNIAKNPTTKEVASEFHISAQQLNRILMRETEHTIAQLITEIRLNTVKQLLEGTDLPLGLIAEKVGISNEYNMNRFFKEHSGLTPGKYRNIFKRS